MESFPTRDYLNSPLTQEDRLFTKEDGDYLNNPLIGNKILTLIGDAKRQILDLNLENIEKFDKFLDTLKNAEPTASSVSYDVNNLITICNTIKFDRPMNQFYKKVVAGLRNGFSLYKQVYDPNWRELNMNEKAKVIKKNGKTKNKIFRKYSRDKLKFLFYDMVENKEDSNLIHTKMLEEVSAGYLEKADINKLKNNQIRLVTSPMFGIIEMRNAGTVKKPRILVDCRNINLRFKGFFFFLN